jgi:O-phosphoseryl-tRNA(Cys) synthetase
MSFGNSISSSELSMLSSEQSVLLSISETWGSFEVLRVILGRMTDEKTVRKLKKGKPFVLYDGVLDLFNAYWNIGYKEIHGINT